MLYLLDKTYTKIATFPSYDEFIDFINQSQVHQLYHPCSPPHSLEGRAGFSKNHWRFVYYKHKDLTLIYSAMKEPPIEVTKRQAFDWGFDLIEAQKGEGTHPIQVLVTATLDVGEVKRSWCVDFCKAHQYILLDTQNYHEGDF